MMYRDIIWERRQGLSSKTDHYSVADFCIYEGREVKGWPILTMLRGNVLVDDGKMVAKPGLGKYVSRSIS